MSDQHPEIMSAADFLRKYTPDGKPRTASRSIAATPVAARPGGKYGVAPAEKRTARGRVYASKAEREYADALWLRFEAGDVLLIVEQPKFRLGADTNYVADFLFLEASGVVRVVDIKGVETTEFQRAKRLWERYQRTPLEVIGKKERYIVDGLRQPTDAAGTTGRVCGDAGPAGGRELGVHDAPAGPGRDSESRKA